MMKHKARRITLEDGSHVYESIDGKRYKTRSGAWKRNQKLSVADAPTETAKEPQEDPVGMFRTTNASDRSQEQPSATEDDPTFDGPEWAQFDFGEAPEGTQVIPEPLKRFRQTGSKGKQTKAGLKAEAETNKAILMMGYRTGDHLLTRYGRVVTVDDTLVITHSQEDYEWISDVTHTWMEDQGISIASAVGPGMLALGANAIWFGQPLVQIQRKAKKSILRGAGEKLGGMKKWFRLPKFLRKKKRITPEIDDDLFTGEEGFEP